MGDGGEGLVFRATANCGEQEHDVALKMHTSLTLDDFERFSRRAHALSEIDHPNVMHMIEVFIGTALVDCDDSPDEAFNVMYTVAEWIPGLSLPVALEATSAASGLHWVSEVKRATSYLHDFRSADAPEGLIHRDIKPSNVRITYDERAVPHRFRHCPAPSERGPDRGGWDLPLARPRSRGRTGATPGQRPTSGVLEHWPTGSSG